jgi:hypothetical protein
MGCVSFCVSTKCELPLRDFAYMRRIGLKLHRCDGIGIVGKCGPGLGLWSHGMRVADPRTSRA